MKLKKKPVEPKRKKRIRICFGSLYEESPLSIEDIEGRINEIVKATFNPNSPWHQAWLTIYKVNPEDIYDLEISLGYESDLDIAGYRDESDVEFNKRVATYQKNLANYVTWKQQNKDAIKTELAARQKKAEEAIIEKKAQLKKDNETTIKKLQAKLDKLRDK